MSDRVCPEDGGALAPIPLERADGAVHHCPGCYGVWVDRELIERLGEAVESSPPSSAVGLPTLAHGPSSEAPATPRTYRPCPVCGALMAWRTCGGLTVDVCSEHGVWFEAGDLEPFIAWMRAGRPRSGTHHETLPLAEYLGIAAPLSPSGEGTLERPRSGQAEVVAGAIEALEALVHFLTR